MSEPSCDFDPVDDLADAFLERYRRGERPSLSEYTDKYPDLAERIRAVFPALIVMEEIGAEKNQGTGLDVEPFGSGVPIAHRLGDFVLIRRVGAGGMGIVYEAEHESLKSRMALKVMHPRLRSDRAYVRRFQTEARSAAKLHHTNIVSVFSYGEQDGVCYYAMQYIVGVGLERVLDDVRRLRGAVRDNIGGGTEGEENEARIDGKGELLTAVSRGLISGQFVEAAVASPVTGADATLIDLVGGEAHDLIRGDRTGADGSFSALAVGRADPDSSSLASQTGSIYFREVARLGAQVADALDYAHRQGVIHRDIKPSNLLLDIRGNVWVTDFGLAKLVEGDELSQSHELVGTLRFMAPERFRGVTDSRGDVYSLGATLYELLTLKPAFAERDQARLIDQIARVSPVSLRQHDHRIPRDLETLVQKALAKDPKDRFATAAEFGHELERYLESRPIHSRRIGPAERAWRWCRRSPAVAGLTALAVALTLFVAIVSTIAAWTYRASLARAEKAERQARLALGNSLISEGAALQRTGLSGQRFDSLDRLERAAQVLGADREGRDRLPEIRNHAIAALGLTDLRIRQQHAYGDVPAVTVDAALGLYAVVERSRDVIVLALDDGHELARLPGLANGQSFRRADLAFSPDGELVAINYITFGGQALLRILHLGRRELVGSLSSWGIVAFQADGRRLAFGAPEGGITVWDARERRVVHHLPLGFPAHRLAFDPAGRRLAVNNGDAANPRVTILDVETGRVLFDRRSQVGPGAIAWSADGQLLAVGGTQSNARVYVWNVHDGALSSILKGHTAAIVGATFAHSGHLLATSSFDGTTRLWDGVSGEPLATAPGTLQGSFAEDDSRLAFSTGGKIGVWDVAVASECRTLHPGMIGNRSETAIATVVESADVSPDARLLATGDADGVRLWDVYAGRELAHLKCGPIVTVLFHPDGQHLISSGRWGLYRWPIRPDPDRGPYAIRVGPPELLRESSGGEFWKATWLPDHRTLAFVENANGRIVLVDSGHPHPAWSRTTALDSGGNTRMTSVAVSPDGRWLAAGGWQVGGVRVWDLRRRRLERFLTPQNTGSDLSFSVGFSADGRWLVSSTRSAKESYHFWHVGSWELGACIDQERNGIAFHSPAFTSDGRLMAMGIAPDQILLADVATGRGLARLTTLQPLYATPLVFSPDGTTLIARTAEKTVLVWNLQRIRDQLAPLGLDWNAPPYRAAPDFRDLPGQLSPPRTVRVVGEVMEPQARRAAEWAEMNRRLAAKPSDADALIHRGWLSTTQRQWREAIVDLEHGLRLRADDSDAWWLLGDAYQETGKLGGAMAAYTRLVERAPEDLDARFQRARLALAAAQPGLAVEDLSHVLATRPDWEGARYRRAQALIRLGRHREALADLDTEIANTAGDHALYELRAIVGEALGDREHAGADREKASSLLPKNVFVLNNRAWRAATEPIAQRDPDRAVVLARRAVELAPQSKSYLNTLGVALYRAGQYAEAISFLDRSAAAREGDIDPNELFFLAMAHHELGHHLKARGYYDEAVRWLRARNALADTSWNGLAEYRAEAESILASSADDLPDQVMANPR